MSIFNQKVTAAITDDIISFKFEFPKAFGRIPLDALYIEILSSEFLRTSARLFPLACLSHFLLLHFARRISFESIPLILVAIRAYDILVRNPSYSKYTEAVL